MISVKKLAILNVVVLLICVALCARSGQRHTHNVDADSQSGSDEWNRMSKEERTTNVAYYLMGKFSAVDASCTKRFSEEVGYTQDGKLDVDEYTRRCRAIEGVSQINVAKAGDLTSEANRIRTIIDEWYRLFPRKRKVPFLALVDAISNEPIRNASDLDAQFNSLPYLR